MLFSNRMQIRDSPFIMAGGENVEAPTGVPQRRKLLKEFTQTILVLLEHYQVLGLPACAISADSA